MSLIPPDSTFLYYVNVYASVQVAVTSAALYDHGKSTSWYANWAFLTGVMCIALALGREVELIWMKPPSLVTVLYIIERYLGDVVLVVFFCIFVERGKSTWILLKYNSLTCMAFSLVRCMRLFEIRAWGALAYSWATQATMQLRIYAMYRRSRGILTILVAMFLCEIAAIIYIIWQTIGPRSHIQATSIIVFGNRFCTFSGITGNFVYIFIPFLCFEFFLFALAVRMFVENMKQNRETCEKKRLGLDSFMRVLARDSLCYFFVNLVTCAVVTGLWQNLSELYANICVPFVMLLEVLVGTRLILDFRERYARSDSDPVILGRHGSLHFRPGEIRMDSPRVSIRCQIETIVVTDAMDIPF